MDVLNRLSTIVAPIFYELLAMSIISCVIGLVLLFIRHVFDRQISPFWKSMLWLVMLVGLLIPYHIESQYSVVDEVYEISSLSFREPYDEANHSYELLSKAGADVEEVKQQVQILYFKSLVFDVWVPLVWFFGSIGMLVYLILTRLCLAIALKRHRIPTNELVMNCLAKCKQTLGIRKPIKVVTQNYLNSPALVGVLRPTIILPSYELTETSLCYVLLHELGHYKRKDLILNHVLLALGVVYWFNPLVYVLFKYVREDLEVANDAYVLRYIEDDKQYAKSLIEILAKSQHLPFAPKVLCMVDGRKNTERRISMIKLGGMFKRYKVLISVLCVALIMGVSLLFLTKKPSQLQTPPALYVHTGDEVFELEMGGYTWEVNGEVTIADALPYYEFEYDESSTFNMLSEPSLELVFSTSKDKIQNGDTFELTEVIYNVEGQGVYMTGFKDDRVDIWPVSKDTAWYYGFEVKFDQGTVLYGIKVVQDQAKFWDAYITTENLPPLEEQPEREVWFDNHRLTLEARLDNELEDFIYEHYYTMMGEEGTPLEDCIIHDIELLSKEEAINIIDFKNNEVFSADITQSAIVKVEVTEEYQQENTLSGNDRYETFYILERRDNRPWEFFNPDITSSISE